MKQLLCNLCAGALILGSAQAAVVFNESFGYADGSLSTVSAGVWANHSGTLGQVDVVSGKVNLTQTESEDVNAPLEGRPHAAGNLYASFIINLSTAPSGVGGYFAHFKDDGTANLRARVFVTTNGVTANQFRVGIAAGGNTFVAIPTDLSFGQDYLLVVRYNIETPGASLWINPSSEGSTTDRADASDSPGVVSMTTFALRQSLNNGAGMGTLTLDDLKIGTTFGDVVGGSDPTLNPPSIGSIASQSIPANSSTIDIPFTISDGETPAADLTLAASSDNLGLVPVEAVAFGGSEGNRTVKVTPAAGQQGAAVVTVTVTDSHNNTATRTFRVVVGAPTVSAIANQTTPKDVITQPIPFTVGDPESDALTLTALSSNEALVPSANVIFDGAGAERTITVIPSAGAPGVTRIWVFVSDGFNTVSNSFILTVFQTRGVDLTETFTYNDGPVTTNSSFVWTTHSGSTGQTGQTQVLEGKLLLSSTQGEDINAYLLTGPYLPTEGWILYSSFTVNFSARPSAAGDYFAHFRNVGNSFGARVFATTTGAGADKLRLGIANNTASPSAVLPVDLDLGTTYTVVTRLNVGTGQSTIWVNPASEADTSATAIDNAFPFDVWTFAFRQSGGIGSLAVDDLKVGTSFSDVSETRYRLQITATGNSVRVSWLKAAQTAGYRLQGNAGLDAGGWADVNDATTEQGDNLVVTFTGTTGNRFFRLIK